MIVGVKREEDKNGKYRFCAQITDIVTMDVPKQFATSGFTAIKPGTKNLESAPLSLAMPGDLRFDYDYEEDVNQWLRADSMPKKKLTANEFVDQVNEDAEDVSALAEAAHESVNEEKKAEAAQDWRVTAAAETDTKAESTEGTPKSMDEESDDENPEAEAAAVDTKATEKQKEQVKE